MTLAVSVLAGTAPASSATAGHVGAAPGTLPAAEKGQRQHALAVYQEKIVAVRRAVARTHKNRQVRRPHSSVASRRSFVPSGGRLRAR